MKSPFAWFRAVLCLSTATMMVVSWPLWVTYGLFPRVPWFGWVRLLPLWASWVRFAIALIAMLAASAGWRWRTMLGVALAMSAWMVLEDQFRLQPWMYQFLLMGYALVACPETQGIGLCRLFLIALYFHSGLSKLDGSFIHGLGVTFLDTGSTVFRFSTNGWPEWVRTAAVAAMPACEMMIAFGLYLPITRRAAMVAAVLLHVALLAILGPLGLGHSANVLIWNLSIAVEVVLLFAAISRSDATEVPSLRVRQVAIGAAKWLIVLAALLPFTECAGWWDSWPSFALYSARDERTVFFYDVPFGAPTSRKLPSEIGRHSRELSWTDFGPIESVRTYSRHRLDINEWSLAKRRTPIYPQNRALNGVAEALASRYRLSQEGLIHLGRAYKFMGVRSELLLEGLPAIRRHGDTYWLNAHPARD